MELILLVVSAFFTSSISAVIGMGGGIILLGIMAILIPEGYMVIALHGMIQLFSNFTRSIIFRNHIKINIIKEFSIGSSIGLFVSALIILILIQIFQVDSANKIKFDILKPLIGIFILWYLFIKKSKQKKKINTFIWPGGLSGVSSVFIGATGPLIAPFFINDKLNKENIIANKAACQVVSHLGKIPLFMYFFNVSYFSELDVLVPLIIAVFIGTNFGKYLLKFIPENLFKILFKYALTIIAIKLIIDQLIFII